MSPRPHKLASLVKTRRDAGEQSPSEAIPDSVEVAAGRHEYKFFLMLWRESAGEVMRAIRDANEHRIPHLATSVVHLRGKVWLCGKSPPFRNLTQVNKADMRWRGRRGL